MSLVLFLNIGALKLEGKLSQYAGHEGGTRLDELYLDIYSGNILIYNERATLVRKKLHAMYSGLNKLMYEAVCHENLFSSHSPHV